MARHPHTLTSADDIALTGPSDLPDPSTHAYRKDLADVALASRVIASHYAVAVRRKLRAPAKLRAAPGEKAEALAELPAEAPFLMLDDSLGWAWGYGGEGEFVGYVPSELLTR